MYLPMVVVLLPIALAAHSVSNEETKHVQNDRVLSEIESHISAGEFAPDDRRVCESDGCLGASIDGTIATSTRQEDEVTRAMADDGWDRGGYITFCPCMGNFGNQMEQYLGAIAFAKALKRTLILPPFYLVTYRGPKVHNVVPFTDLFQVGPLLAFHRSITMDDFLGRLAPKYWPTDRWKGYSFKFIGRECSMTQGGLFWEYLSSSVSFDECLSHQLSLHADMDHEESFDSIRTAWNDRFPPDKHPVLALNQAPGWFPMHPGNRKLQRYIRWSEEAFAEARAYIAESFGTESWVAIHLRNGGDWVKACDMDLEAMSFFMASKQCHEMKVGAVTKEMCLPSLTHMLDLTLRVFQDVNAKHLFIATDKHPYLQDFKTLLNPLGVSVHYLKPDTPQVDLMILGQADYFIGSCVSSFTSFVKRERDSNGKPSIFWGLEYNGFQ